MTSVAGLPSYVVISPVKDEGRFLQRMGESLARQSHAPMHWVIVDDGSTDDTAEVADRFAVAHNWVSVVRREPAAGRTRGAPVVHAFNAGLAVAPPNSELVSSSTVTCFCPPTISNGWPVLSGTSRARGWSVAS